MLRVLHNFSIHPLDIIQPVEHVIVLREMCGLHIYNAASQISGIRVGGKSRIQNSLTLVDHRGCIDGVHSVKGVYNIHRLRYEVFLVDEAC